MTEEYKIKNCTRGYKFRNEKVISQIKPQRFVGGGQSCHARGIENLYLCVGRGRWKIDRIYTGIGRIMEEHACVEFTTTLLEPTHTPPTTLHIIPTIPPL